MSRLPDLEGLAIFAKVVEHRSFAGAASDLAVSKATVSKAVGRLERRIGARLLNRTSRRLALTEAGHTLAARAQAVLAEAEAAEAECLSRAAEPRGSVRLAAPMSFGLRAVADLLPDFLAAHPFVSVDLHLSDDLVDLVGGGFDVALRIAALADSSLKARRLAPVERIAVAAPAYLARNGEPRHPADLASHPCLTYAYSPTPETWRFRHVSGEEAQVRPKGPLRANNADALVPALCAGLGVAVQPVFIVAEALREGRLVQVLGEWSPPPVALHLVQPPGGPRPVRVELFCDYLAKTLTARLKDAAF